LWEEGILSNKNAYGEMTPEKTWSGSLSFRYNSNREVTGALVVIPVSLQNELDLKAGDRVIVRDHTSVNAANSPQHPVPIHTTLRLINKSPKALVAPIHLAYMLYFGTTNEPQITFGLQKEIKREVPL